MYKETDGHHNIIHNIQGESERSTTDLWKIIKKIQTYYGLNIDMAWKRIMLFVYCEKLRLFENSNFKIWAVEHYYLATFLETFLSTKPVFFEILYFSQFDPPAKTMVYLSFKWNNGRKCNIIGKGNTWAFRWYDT